MANNNRVREIEEEAAMPLLQKTSESDSIHPRTQTVTTKSRRLRCTSRGARDLQHGFKSIYAFTPESGRGVPIRFNPRNGRSLLTYRDDAVIYVDGEPNVKFRTYIDTLCLFCCIIWK
ncbi:carbamoyl-phosphate synthase large chain [Striga asiatica]|uniref:Carbamoyl-phosphate synthase large chain n=1 Tax=Striga asiatica TaxID=4170 RepID=A0A5A7P9M6_STRAF|nr:carbamoyl-phosphate synthase large chain [Striga asiatica]